MQLNLHFGSVRLGVFLFLHTSSLVVNERPHITYCSGRSSGMLGFVLRWVCIRCNSANSNFYNTRTTATVQLCSTSIQSPNFTKITLHELRPCGNETAEHLLLLCPKWVAECQQYFGDSTDISDVFQNSDNLVEFLIALKHHPHSHPIQEIPDRIVTTTTTRPVFFLNQQAFRNC